FVLAAHLVEIDQRQPRLDHARHRDVEAMGGLVAPIRRAVRHQQNLAAGLAHALDYVGAPDVLADGNADAHAPEHDRPGHGAGYEPPLLVEHAVIGQVDLVADRFDTAVRKQEIRVVELAVLDPWRAHEDRGAAVVGVAGERLDLDAAGRLEA